MIAPHHPDRLGRPSPRIGAIDSERFQQALTWNVFRSLELIAPAFWLRRLHTRLTGAPPPAAPQIVRVCLWRSLPLPPIRRVDGAQPDIVVDVVIETEHAVWTLIVAADRDQWADEDRAAHVVDAGAWLAGAREHHWGVIEADTTCASLGGVLRSRYARSRESVGLRSATRGPTKPASAACGTVQWTDLAVILRDCETTHTLSAIERALAGNALAWLRAVGLEAS